MAQQGKIYHEVFSKKEGLELDNISALVYDDDGFLWLGGRVLDVRTIVNSDKRNRLQRFNGTVFHNIDFPDTEETILEVDQLVKRADGKIYVHAILESGHVYYLLDPITTQLEKIEFDANRRAKDYFSYIFPHDGKNYFLWQEEREITVCILKDDLSAQQLFSFTSDENKFLIDPSTVFIPFENFCVISDDNFPIHFIDWQGTVLKKFSGESFTRSRNLFVEKFYLDELFTKNDTVFTFPKNKKQLHYIDAKTLDVVPVASKNSRLQYSNLQSYKDTAGNEVLVNATRNSVTFNTWTENGFLVKNDVEVSINGLSVNLFSDNVNDEVWLGTNEKELHYFKFPSRNISTVLPEFAMRSIYPLSKNEVLIATENEGWYRYNKNNKSLKPYVLSEEGISYKPTYSRNIIQDGETLWSNNSSQILEIDTLTKQVRSYRHFPVACLEELNDSTLIYGTRGYNLMKFNKRTKKHTNIIPTDSLFIYDIAIHDSFLVGATDKGLLTYDFKNEETNFYNSKAQLGDTFLLMTDYVEGVGFVTGSRAGNVGIFNSTTRDWKLEYQDALEAGIATILYDNDRWCINTFNGMVFYTPSTKKSTRFSTADGLTHNEANRYSALKTDSTYWVGSLKGLNYFSPEDIAPKEIDANLILQRMRRYDPKSRAFQVNFNQKELLQLDVVILPAEQRELELDFVLTNTTAPNEHSFTYRLNGAEWLPLPQGQTISFPNMAPGSYELEVVATDFSGNKIGETLLIPIVAKNFFYRTWWFYLLVSSVAIMLLLYFLRQSRSKQRMQQQFSIDLLTSQEKERNHIAKELHDSVGQQLTLIKKNAQRQGAKDLTQLTNTVLEEVRGISRGLYPANLRLLGLTESIEQLVYDLDEQTDTFFSVDIVDIDSFFNEQETLNIYRFVQECLTNSVKHANASAAEIEVLANQNQVVLKMADNGQGFNVTDATMKKSLGLKTLSERIKIVGGTLTIKSKPGQGTIVIAIIPKK